MQLSVDLRKLRRWYKRLPDVRKRIIWVAGAILLIAIPSFFSVSDRISEANATVGFYLDTPVSVKISTPFQVQVHLTTTHHSVSTISTELQVNPQQLQIESINTQYSFCTFYTQKTFDAIQGTVQINCGTPSPGFTGDSTVAIVTLQPITTGSSIISFTPSASHILANDGKGTDILDTIPSATLQITN